MRRELDAPRPDPAARTFRMPVFQGDRGLAPGVTPEDLHSNARLDELQGDRHAV